MTNQLFFGDNLHILREHIPDQSVDLIYLDPPFNSKRDYNVLFKTPKGHTSDAQITAFEDSWHWGEQAEREYRELLAQPNTNVAEMVRALRSFLGENDMMAYLVMMANRLLELHRVLKETGTLYLHCDPTASHYLKIVLDAVFGKENYRNEIIWRRSHPKGQAFTRFANNHDVILGYAKDTSQTKWNPSYKAYDPDRVKKQYSLKDENGRYYQLTSLLNPNPDRPNLTYEFKGVTKVWRWTKERMMEEDRKGNIVVPRGGKGIPRYKRYLDEQEGIPVDDVWNDIELVSGNESLGYPTQKPLSLLERILQASSNEGDVVLDPFCGCGTAVHAAEKLNRKWTGIDITHLAISLIEKRLRDAFPSINFIVEGTPKDLDGARNLAIRDKYQFQWWACSLVGAQPYQGKKKGADSGIDGLIFFHDDAGEAKKIVVSVKGGENVSVAMVRDLAHVVEREKAEIGLFVTLAAPTDPMKKEAIKEGFYESPGTSPVPKIQILTIEGLLSKTERPEYKDYSLGAATFKKAAKSKKQSGQETLGM
jgi:site-specific DNA-methyltransferase (adenine-specific)